MVGRFISQDRSVKHTAACVVGVSGYSGSGKTTLIEKLLPDLKKQGLTVGVVKHIHHELEIDVKGKDTDRFFRAGADYVFAHDANQGFLRGRYREAELCDILDTFPRGLDLIIVEGHKGCASPGIWLEKKGGKKGETAGDPLGKKIIFRDDPEYPGKVLSHIREEIEGFHARRAINAGLLIGGKSSRMGRPKALLRVKGKTLAERSLDILSEVSDRALLLGAGRLPRSFNSAESLPDVTGVKGPLAGILSAFRWAPNSSWIISSVDMPLMRKEAWKWLLSQRRPGVWAVLPKAEGSGRVETTGGVYEPMIFEYVESLAKRGVVKLQEIARHPKVMTPVIPKPFVLAWMNVNTTAEWRGVVKRVSASDINRDTQDKSS